MKLKRDEIQQAVADDDWQEFRISLKGLSTEEKLQRLEQYLEQEGHSHVAQVRVQNYINALKRGGQIK